MKYIVIFITAKNMQEAKKISKKLLEEKLIACANIFKNVESFFWWKGKMDSAKEVLLVLKTQKVFFKEIVQIVKSVHSYDVPEVISFNILDGNPDYLKWIDESLRKDV